MGCAGGKILQHSSGEDGGAVIYADAPGAWPSDNRDGTKEFTAIAATPMPTETRVKGGALFIHLDGAELTGAVKCERCSVDESVVMVSGTGG